MYIVIYQRILYDNFFLQKRLSQKLYVHCQLALSHTDMLLKVSSTAYISIYGLQYFQLKSRRMHPEWLIKQ